jgi:DNA polymerase III epsilon subunit-like protein
VSRIIFIDTETTGLDAATCEVIEVAIITEDGDGNVLERWVSKVAPQHIEDANPRALEINGYTPEKWAGAPTLEVVARAVAERVKNTLVCGHHVAFDIGFLSAMLTEAGIKQGIGHRGVVDTITLALEHLRPTGLQSVSLVNCRRWLGWTEEGAHTALADAEAARQLYHTLVRATDEDRARWAAEGPANMAAALAKR